MKLTTISSMATRQLLAELAQAFQQVSGIEPQVESVGGVDAAKRVLAGEAFEVVVLASDAIAKLEAAGRLVPGSVVDLVRSEVVVAVPAGQPRPDIGTEAAVKAAVQAAPSLGYSTGPSGVALAQLFARWGVAEELAPRIVTPPPGTPVGAWVGSGQIALGFQQRAEMVGLPGVDVLGPLPPEIAIVTRFTAALVAGGQAPEAARAWVAFMASPEAADIKRRQGMEPA